MFATWTELLIAAVSFDPYDLSTGTDRLHSKRTRNGKLTMALRMGSHTVGMLGKTALWLVLTVALATVSMAIPQDLPDGEGKKLVEERCGSCHSLKPIVSLNQSKDSWKEMIVRMRAYGAPLDN